MKKPIKILTADELLEKLGACGGCGWKRGELRAIRTPGAGELRYQVPCAGVRDPKTRKFLHANVPKGISHTDCPVRENARKTTT